MFLCRCFPCFVSKDVIRKSHEGFKGISRWGDKVLPIAYPEAGKIVNLHFPWIYIFAKIYISNLRKLKGKCKFYIFLKNLVFRLKKNRKNRKNEKLNSHLFFEN